MLRNFLKGIKTKQPPSIQPSNPYLAARLEWNERYGDYIAQCRNWRLLAFISALCVLLMAGGLIYLGSQPKKVPYVVEVDKLGQLTYAGKITPLQTPDEKLMKAFLSRFVMNWRGQILDKEAQQQALNQVYAMLPENSSSLTQINEYFKTHSPFQMPPKESVQVEVVAVLPISHHTWQVRWHETHRAINGLIFSEKDFQAVLTCALRPLNDERLLQVNPLGLFIVDLHWAEEVHS